MTLNRFPSIRKPTSGAADGRIMQTTAVTVIGNRISSFLETGLSEVIFIARSFFVVTSFMIGGCIIGISAMYEYAAMAIAPRSVGASSFVTSIAVGPSAPPIIPIAAAAASENPRKTAPANATNTPS